MEVIEKTVVIRNKTGLHARPAALFVQKASQFVADITISKGDTEVSAKSIMGVMSLAASQGTEITLRARGEDAQQAVAALEELLNSFSE